MRAIYLMKNSSTFRGTAFHLNDNLQRGQCCSTELRTPMKTCPGCCWKLGILSPIHTALLKKILLRLRFRPKSFRSHTLSWYLPTISRAGRSFVQLCWWKSGVKVPLEGPSCNRSVRQALEEHLTIMSLIFPVSMKKLKYIYMILCDGKTHWEEYFNCDEKNLI